MTPAATWAQVGTSSTSTGTLDLSLVDGETDPAPERADRVEDEVDDVIEEIVVTGSRTEKLLSDAPIATDVLAREALQDSGAANLESILETMPGVQLQRGANNTGVQLQGLSPEHVLVLVDSERIAGKTRDQFDIGQFDLENAERIEIVRGSASSLYGADAIGGVINIITRLPKKPVESSARLTYGQFNVLDLIGNAGTRQGKLALNVSGGLHRSDAYDLDPDDGTTNGNPTTGDGLMSWNVAARAEYDADDDTRAALRFRYRTADVHGVSAANNGLAIIDRNERIERFSLSGGPVLRFDDLAQLRVSVVHSQYRQQIVQNHIRSDELDSFFDNRQTSNQVIVQYDRLFSGGHFVSAGVEGLHEAQEVSFIEGGVEDRRRAAVFLQDEWTVFEDASRLVIIPSVRYDADSQFGGQPSPRLAARFDPFRELILRASYGWGFRPPTFENLYSVFDNSTNGYRVDGNPSLVPETSQSVNVDVSYRFLDDFTVTAAAFFNLVDDLIATVPFEPNDRERPCGPATLSGITQFCYDNIADARTMGASFGLGYAYDRYIEANLSLDLLQTSGLFPGDPEDAVDPSMPPPAVRHELPGRPNVRGTLRVTGRMPDWGTKLIVRAALEGDSELFADFDLDGTDDIRKMFTLVDLRVAQDLFGHAEAFVGVENLLDAGDHFTLPIQPRTFYGGVAGRFDIEPAPRKRP